jgi:exopolyphosphatase / guanosine-5'-triphosphate,3'-diphosphate pyrophosphatase
MISAALDIGSNSIHLIVVETDREKPFRVLTRAKEVVRLGRSTARDRKLSNQAIDRALSCIRRFRQRAEICGASELIAVATSAVREATNRADFIRRVHDETGVHVELLSGIEEARLIALAVSVKNPQAAGGRSLVVDIGGGSTELAVTVGGEPAVLISLKLGAVRLTEQYVTSDPVSEKQLRRLRSELRKVLEQRVREIQRVGFDVCFGTSGTINALAAMAMRRRMSQHRLVKRAAHQSHLELPLTFRAVRALNKELALLSIEDRSRMAGLNRVRSEIIIGGGQLLEAIMEAFGIVELTACDWALREGLIIAHLSRRGAPVTASPARLERDPSLRGALALAQYYHADLKHAHRVAYLSQQLFDGLRSLHMLGWEHRRLLTAAALLHDIGYLVSHTGHNKHSAYLIQNSELTGFTSSEIALIANVARYHRSSLPKATHPYYQVLAEEDRQVIQKLAAILRLADALDRDHEGRVRSVRCEIGDQIVHFIANCPRESDTTRWRFEERADLFSEVYGRSVGLGVELALASPARQEAVLK